jgi:phospholipid transport system substrate-binding protein
MVRSFLKGAALAATLVFGTSTVGAQEQAPDAVVRTVTEQVITLVKQSRGNFNAAQTNQVNTQLERSIIPLFDFSRMTQIAVARNWATASAEQRSRLTTEFQALLVRTYSTAIRNYRDENIEFKPLDLPPGATQAMVSSVVKRSGTGRVSIDYEMQKTPAGWKVYEIRMDGVNLIANYRETFATKVRDSGLDGLIQALAEKNRQSS